MLYFKVIWLETIFVYNYSFKNSDQNQQLASGWIMKSIYVFSIQIYFLWRVFIWTGVWAVKHKQVIKTVSCVNTSSKFHSKIGENKGHSNHFIQGVEICYYLIKSNTFWMKLQWSWVFFMRGVRLDLFTMVSSIFLLFQFSLFCMFK